MEELPNRAYKHLINIGDFHTMHFSIDFEPVEIRMSKEFYDAVHGFGGSFAMQEWQQLMDWCCDGLKKERRTIEAFNWQFSGLPKNFDKTCYEFVAYSASTWTYLMRTKTYHFSKFYERHKLIEDADREKNYLLREHYRQVARFLTMQGLVGRLHYHEPTLDMIDQFIKKFINPKQLK